MEKSLQVVIINQRCGLGNQGSLHLPGRRSRAESWSVDDLPMSDGRTHSDDSCENRDARCFPGTLPGWLASYVDLTELQYPVVGL